MQEENRWQPFVRLGEALSTLPAATRLEWQQAAQNENPWFTPGEVDRALRGLSVYLAEESLRAWLGQYPVARAAKTVGVAMAGNLPLVGFHDVLCVLAAGHRLQAKLSTQDSALMMRVLRLLIGLEPGMASRIEIVDRLKGVEAVIATGSDNTARYFEYYFRHIPHIIRKNRTSVAVLMGEEPEEEWKKMGEDVFAYFGLGCRNISKLYLPDGFDLASRLGDWQEFESVMAQHKYAHNYDYQKSILLVNQVPHLDTGFLLLRAQQAVVSPVAVLYYEHYRDQADLGLRLAVHADKIQCVASARAWWKGSVAFGETQRPGLTDYADGVDTLAFLSAL